MLSDAELIQAFVEHSIQQKEVLLANRMLRGQQVGNRNQLLDKTIGLVLTAQPTEASLQFWLRGETPYWEMGNQILASHCFIVMGASDKNQFYPYEYCKPPQGYQMNCTKAVHLWRAWWQHRKNIINTALPLELMIRSRNTWYPIRDIVFGQGFLYIKTLGAEIDITADDMICWLRKLPRQPVVSAMVGSVSEVR